MKSQSPSTAVVMGLMGLIAIVFLGIFGLVALGRDIQNVVYFIGPTLVLLGGILATLLKVHEVAKETSAQSQKIDDVKHAVNGELDAKFNSVHKRIDGLSNQVALANGLKKGPQK